MAAKHVTYSLLRPPPFPGGFLMPKNRIPPPPRGVPSPGFPVPRGSEEGGSRDRTVTFPKEKGRGTPHPPLIPPGGIFSLAAPLFSPAGGFFSLRGGFFSGAPPLPPPLGPLFLGFGGLWDPLDWPGPVFWPFWAPLFSGRPFSRPGPGIASEGPLRGSWGHSDAFPWVDGGSRAPPPARTRGS